MLLDRIGRRRDAVPPVLVPALVGALAASVVLPEAVGLGRTRYRPMVVPFRPVLAGALIALGSLLGAVRPIRAAGVAAAVVGVGGLVSSSGNHRVENLGTAAPAPDAQVTALRVLSANVLQGRADPDVLAAIIARYAPDVVVLPEAGDRFRRRLARRLPPGYRSWSSGPGVAVDRRTARHPDGPCVSVVVADRLGEVEVWPLERETAHGWLEVRGGALGHRRLLAVHPVAPHLHRSRRWAAELTLLGHELRVPGTVVAGDLNASLEHAELRALLRHATSATAVAGGSRVGTWPTRWPRWLGIGIDHVLAGEGVVARGATVLDVAGSDHRAVLAELVLS